METRTMTPGATVTLSIPADRSMMLVARLTSAAVLARSGVDADMLDEMKMAVEESVTCLLQSGGICAVRLSFVRTQGGLQLEITGIPDDSVPAGHPMDEDELTVVRCILETMVENVSVRADHGRIRSIVLYTSLAT